MSDELKLSRQLVDNVMDAVISVDSRARDPFVGSQYLTAVVGYVIGTSSIPDQEKKQIMDELSSFMHHVFKDMSEPQSQATPVAPPGSAFGIWKPGDA